MIDSFDFDIKDKVAIGLNYLCSCVGIRRPVVFIKTTFWDDGDYRFTIQASINNFYYKIEYKKKDGDFGKGDTFTYYIERPQMFGTVLRYAEHVLSVEEVKIMKDIF